MYESSITREHRTAFMILLDQSGSMRAHVDIDGRVITNAEAVAEVANQIIGELIERARRHDGVRDYYDVAIVGYSGEDIDSMLSEDDACPFVSISELAKREVSYRSRVVDHIAPNGMRAPYCIEEPQWIEPRAEGGTPMYRAFSYAYDHIKRWCSNPLNYDSFPPIIFNITDGESSDCSAEDFIALSQKIRMISTNDGYVFVINIHISSDNSSNSVIFPTLAELSDRSCFLGRRVDLGRASSVMPSVFNEVISELRGVSGMREFVGVGYNTSIEELITILNIGTISIKRG